MRARRIEERTLGWLAQQARARDGALRAQLERLVLELVRERGELFLGSIPSPISAFALLTSRWWRMSAADRRRFCIVVSRAA